MREIRTSGSEGGEARINWPFLPLSVFLRENLQQFVCAQTERAGREPPRPTRIENS